MLIVRYDNKAGFNQQIVVIWYSYLAHKAYRVLLVERLVEFTFCQDSLDSRAAKARTREAAATLCSVLLTVISLFLKVFWKCLCLPGRI